MRHVSVRVAIGVDSDGYRKAFGIAEGTRRRGGSTFSKHPKDQGIKGARILIPDACPGLVESLAKVFPQALWQRCFSVVPKGKCAR
ncbi:transposase [Pelomicrobium methylotrophicum]|uniref:Transposase n=1 Tax=Pelomicrobium methylotrophicum TaxID=2602750 RepID=A0A5C7EV21_9PROT|nr:hypothetical protein FR698_07755 [Pelomicrobium methylotrophicum]